MVDQPTIFFGVGATKSGTSWLYRYLESHPDTHLRSIKELHYFDAREFDEHGYQLRQLNTRLKSLHVALLDCPPENARQISELKGQIADCLDLIALHERPEQDLPAYLGYLNKGRAGQTLIGESTPAYGLLSTQMLAQMAALARRTRFILVLRDPVARLWSHVRMNAARLAARPEDVQPRTNRIFWRFGRGRHPGIWQRSDYRSMLERLSAALRPSQLLVLYYEDLFTQRAIDQICSFLGISAWPAPFSRPVHVGVQATMDDVQRSHAREWLAPQYDYVRNTLGQVPSEWQSNMLEVQR